MFTNPTTTVTSSETLDRNVLKNTANGLTFRPVLRDQIPKSTCVCLSPIEDQLQNNSNDKVSII